MTYAGNSDIILIADDNRFTMSSMWEKRIRDIAHLDHSLFKHIMVGRTGQAICPTSIRHSTLV
jgi:hypothetical protein